ncbi:MAG: phosphatase PAP2 family protein [Tissierellia bacterium]|nr:phosphatase PAP2 family protein [Tissierellia bacterium]
MRKDLDEKGKPKKSFLNNKSMIDTLNNALNGIIGAVRSERNMKIHLFAAILVIGASLVLNVSRIELAILSICIILVFITEFVNTAIEEIVDMTTQGRYSKSAKTIKDISAGAVFVTAVNAVLVGYLIMYEKVKQVILTGNFALKRVFSAPSHLTFLAVGLVLIAVLLLKGLFYKKNTTHLQGGTVSGHSALAFTLATIGSILASNFEVTVIFFIVAALVAEARVEGKLHTIGEVVLGAILGISISLLLFWKYL